MIHSNAKATNDSRLHLKTTIQTTLARTLRAPHRGRLGYVAIATLTLATVFANGVPAVANESVPAARIEGDSSVDVNVGMSGFLKQVVLPGTELTVRDVDPRRSPIALRIDQVYSHGDDFRYDLTFFGLEPGSHNLTEYLARKDDSSTEDLPTIAINVRSILPVDRFAPSEPTQDLITRIGGYYTVMILALLAWVLGLLGILLVGRLKRAAAASNTGAAVSEVGQIQLLLNQAMAVGELSAEQKADLDMRVLNFWRSRRDLSGMAVAESLIKLKQDQQAGPLLKGLERWFYSREIPGRDDIVALLNPMSNIVCEKNKPSATEVSTTPIGGEAS